MTPALSPGVDAFPASAFVEALRPSLLWGVAFIHEARAALPGLAGAARLLADAGEPVVLVCVACCAFWLSGAKRGLSLALAPLAADALARHLAGTLRVPPPFVLEPGINLVSGSGFAFPSSHAAAVSVFFMVFFLARRGVAGPATLIAGGAAGWGRAARAARALRARNVLCAIAFPLPFLLARVYLGAANPADVLAGALLGASLFCLDRFAGRPLASMVSGRLSDYPPAALRNARLLAASGLALALNAVTRDGSTGGMAFGLCAGYALSRERDAEGGSAEETRARVPTARSAFARSLALLVGLATLALILVPLGRVLPGKEHAQYGLFRFARFSLAGFWSAYAVPRLFTKTSSI